MSDQPEINPVREHAISVVKNPKATQHQKLDALLHLMLDNAVQFEVGFDELDGRMDDIQRDVNANPLGWVPEQWRKKVAIAAAAWFGWVSLNLVGVEITIVDIWNRITELI